VFFKLSDELKYIPIVTNISEFEDAARINIKPNYTISYPVFGETITFVPVPQDRDFYCPLSYFSPNMSDSFFQFAGVDVCNQTSWEALITRMLQTNNTFVVEPRLVRTIDAYVLDIGKVIFNHNTNYIDGFAVHSFFIHVYAYNTLANVFPNYSNDSIAIKIDDDENTLFKHHNYDTIDDFYVNQIQVRITAYQILNVTFKFSRAYINSFNSNNNIIVLCVILLLFIIVDIIIFLFFILYDHREDKVFYSQLERQNSYISKMINYVNHEIRNPLNSIIGMVDLTRMDINEMNIEDKSVLISNLDTVYNSGLLIQHIVNDVLDIRKLEEGRLELNYNCINLHHFSRDLIKLLGPKIQEHPHINFSIECNVDKILGDSMRLNQILLNLISNAFKFTTEGFIKVVIEQYSDDYIKFQVDDSGCGIPEENQKLLFRPFEQVNNNIVSRQVGYGLGLYLCKMLVMLMNGDINMSQRDNVQGCNFWFIIPNNPCELKLNMNIDVDRDVELVDL